MMRRLRPAGGLWGHSDFLKLWTGQTISEFGSQVSQLAIPWVALAGLREFPEPEEDPLLRHEPGIVPEFGGR